MEFSIRHRLDALEGLYDALLRERLGRAKLAFWFLALGSATATLVLWPKLNWLFTAVAGASVMAIALFETVRDTTRRQIKQTFEMTRAEPIRYRVDDAGLFEASSIAETVIRWQALDSPRELAGFVLLPRRPVGSGQFIALPLDQLADGARQEIDDRIARAHATRVG